MRDQAAAWFFSPPLWVLKCICKCAYEDSTYTGHGGNVDVT